MLIDIEIWIIVGVGEKVTKGREGGEGGLSSDNVRLTRLGVLPIPEPESLLLHSTLMLYTADPFSQ